MNLKSIHLIEEYLLKRGYKLTWLTLGYPSSSKHLLVTSPTGNNIILSAAKLTYPFNIATAKEIINDKTKTYDIARYLEISIPETICIDASAQNHVDVRNMLDKHKTLVVKPYNGLQSRGLTLDITTKEQLDSAVQYAASISNPVLVQRQFFGEEARFITINGTVQAALLRQKAHVTGDGSSTIAGLIKKENSSRERITMSKVPYPLLNEKLIDPSFFSNEKILPLGEVLELNKSTMIRGGASVYNILSSVHPSYVSIAEKIAKKLGSGFVSIDLMMRDFKAPAETDNYTLIELNSSISLPMCYSCRDGEHFDVLGGHLGPMLEQAIG